MSGYLELKDGAMIAVRDGLVLGRVAACDVVIDDTKASRRHARLIVEAGVVEIEDMESSNGTLLNGKSVDRRMMRDGDEVRIGKTVIVYREGSVPGTQGASKSKKPPPLRTSAGASDIFDDDDDLLGGDSDELSTSDAPADAAQNADLIDDDLRVESSPDPIKPEVEPPKPRPSNVVEFEDEVVEVEQAKPQTHREIEPEIEIRKPERRPAKDMPASGSGGDAVASSQRILQYSKKATGKSPLGDDMSQMAGGMRLMIVVLGIAIGGAIIYGIMAAMQ